MTQRGLRLFIAWRIEIEPGRSRRLRYTRTRLLAELPDSLHAANLSTGLRLVNIDMARVEGEIIINRPVQEVFDFVADERNEPRYNPRMLRAEQISEGPIGPGTRFHTELRTMKRTMPMFVEFTGFERPQRLASTTRSAMMETEGALTFEPVPAGTRMRWSWDVRPRGAMKAMTPFVAAIGRRQEQRIWGTLKRLLESDGEGA
jgi:uncharacterized protein YndB with AHSA1/START domain